MNHLIDSDAQARIALLIDTAVAGVLEAIVSHGNEEGLTAALGHALMRRTISTPDLRVDFRYRQHNKITEEPHSGADGGFMVRVETPDQTVEKVALFQAKLLRGDEDVRTLRISKTDALRLEKQARDMLRHTGEAVAMFYTWKNIYVVDAADYGSKSPAAAKTPLSPDHRLITLGTYLGKWIPRCTKGDVRQEINTRVRHEDGFKHGLSVNVVSQRPGVTWSPDSDEHAWRRRK